MTGTDLVEVYLKVKMVNNVAGIPKSPSQRSWKH